MQATLTAKPPKSRKVSQGDSEAENIKTKGTQSAHIIVQDIIRGLYEGRYVAGQRLSEPDLVYLYGVSRGTVREAINRLAAEGVVETPQFRGARIRRLTAEEAQGVFDVTEVVIGLTARLAATRIDLPGNRDSFKKDLAALLDNDVQLDEFEFVRRRNRFHRTMVAISGNLELERLVPSLQVHLIRRQLNVPRNVRLAGYRKISEAVLSGNSAMAEKAARAYVKVVASYVLPGFQQAEKAKPKR